MSFMTTLTDPPKESFQLSQLIYDTRYRSTTIQIVALIGFLLLLGWIFNNTAQNLEDLGKEPSFKFLTEPAGYDINQRLIDYDSQSTHLRAAFVGLLNTLLVAVMGCVTATILGVVIGVLRLSKNWLVARIMAIYVEMFRNVPVLLWIVFVMAIIIETLPQPRDFRGDGATASMFLNDSVAFTGRGFYVPEVLFSRGLGDIGVLDPFHWPNQMNLDVFGLFNLPLTVIFFLVACGAGAYAVVLVNRFLTQTGFELPAIGRGLVALVAFLIPLMIWHSVFSSYVGEFSVNSLRFEISLDLLLILFVIFLGVLAAKDVSRMADAMQEATGKRPPVAALNFGLIFIPVVVVLIALGCHLGYPELKGFNFQGGTFMRNSLIALWLALSLYTAAFIAEIVRAGILAISHGQTEAAAALGLRPNRIMNLVILPQALRVIIPPLISNYLNLTKNSSLAIAVGYMDITGTLGGITLNQTGRELETLLLLMLCYLIISLSISAVMNWYNESVKLRER